MSVCSSPPGSPRARSWPCARRERASATPPSASEARPAEAPRRPAERALRAGAPIERARIVTPRHPGMGSHRAGLGELVTGASGAALLVAVFALDWFSFIDPANRRAAE